MVLQVEILLLIATVVLGVVGIIHSGLSSLAQSVSLAKLAKATLMAHGGNFKPLDDIAGKKSWPVRFFYWLTSWPVRLFKWLASLRKKPQAEQPFVLSSLLNGTKILIDFSAFSPEGGQDQKQAAEDTSKELFKRYAYVASGLEYRVKRDRLVELCRNLLTLKSSVEALEEETKHINFPGSIADARNMYAALIQKKFAAEQELQAAEAECNKERGECQRLIAEYGELKTAISGDTSWKGNEALHRLLQDAVNLPLPDLVPSDESV